MKIIISLNLLGLIVFAFSMYYRSKLQNKKKVNIIGVLCGVLFIGFSLILGIIYNSQKLNYSGHATGTIVDVYTTEWFYSKSEIRYMYYPVIEFTVDGKKREIMYSYGSNKDYEIGRRVQLNYNPKEPEKFLLEGEKTMAIFSIVLSLFGTTLILISTFAIQCLPTNDNKYNVKG